MTAERKGPESAGQRLRAEREKEKTAQLIQAIDQRAGARTEENTFRTAIQECVIPELEEAGPKAQDWLDKHEHDFYILAQDPKDVVGITLLKHPLRFDLWPKKRLAQLYKAIYGVEVPVKKKETLGADDLTNIEQRANEAKFPIVKQYAEKIVGKISIARENIGDSRHTSDYKKEAEIYAKLENTRARLEKSITDPKYKQAEYPAWGVPELSELYYVLFGENPVEKS